MSHDTTTPSSGDVVRRIANSEPAALAEFYDQHAPLVFSLAARIIDDQTEAEQVVQEVFTQAWEQAARYDGARGPVAVWLAVMTRRRAIERLRALRARLGIATAADAGGVEIPDPARPRGAATLAAEQIARLRYTLAKLPLLQRIAIELAYFEANSRAQIAEKMEQPAETVTVQLRDGLATLRAALTSTL